MWQFSQVSFGRDSSKTAKHFRLEPKNESTRKTKRDFLRLEHDIFHSNPRTALAINENHVSVWPRSPSRGTGSRVNVVFVYYKSGTGVFLGTGDFICVTSITNYCNTCYTSLLLIFPPHLTQHTTNFTECRFGAKSI